MRRFDEDYYLQRFTPRRPRSKWSKVNREKATELIERGEMKPAGLREVERAKADGRWDAAYDSPSTATVPEDLQRELEKNERGSQVLLRARRQEQVRHPVPDPGCQEARDAGAAHRQVRGHAGRAKEALPLIQPQAAPGCCVPHGLKL